MRITKVYTRTGDHGMTRLVGGREVAKDSCRVEAYGSVDELNAIIGLVRSLLLDNSADLSLQMEPLLERVQHDLFDLGAHLATPVESEFQPPGVHAEATSWLENSMDRLNEELSPLEEFILPGGGVIGGHFHMARTVCRRTERRMVTLLSAEPASSKTGLIYLNRLSDWLFVAGRWIVKNAGERELLWRPDLPR